MPNVTTPLPDFKVFFRRLLVPGEQAAAQGVILSPSQTTGAAPTSAQPTVAQQISTAFGQYQPSQYRNAVISKAMDFAAQQAVALAKSQADVSTQTQNLKLLQGQLATITSVSLIPITTVQLNNLSTDAAYYLSTEGSAVAYANSEHSPTAQPPLARDNSRFLATQTNVQSISQTIGNSNPAAATLIASILPILESLIQGSVSAQPSAANGGSPSAPVTLTPTTEETLRQGLTNDLAGLANLFATPSIQATVNSLAVQIGVAQTKLADAQSDLQVLQKSSAISPFYDPILLDCMIGPCAMNTSMNRLGQPGTGSVTFHLPLALNGQVPDLFFGLQVTDVFNLTALEGQTTAATGASKGAPIPAQTISILTANMRETTLLPFDMMQIWARKKYATTSSFPGDYYPIFTGFVTKTNVSYAGSTVSVKIDGEDVGKMVRLARIDADPSLDQSLNALGLGISSYTNSVVAASANGQSGGQMIKNIIGGQSGSYLGMSQASFITTAIYAGNGANLTPVTVPQTSATPVGTNSPTAPVTTLNTSVVNLAWDFSKIQVNVFDDLVSNFPVYSTQLKTAFRLWQTDELTKWEVCSQIAETQEFEFYADNLGVINYHPPLYYLNPFAPQYYIEDVDIISENHSTDESQVVTVMELDTQPSFFANGSAVNPIVQGRSFVSAATQVMQRYGVRYMKKSSPVFSDTSVPSNASQKQSGSSTYTASDAGRMGYARALLNRRNARLKSASITINGTPELRLCNTVALVGNLGSTLQSVSLNPFATSAPGAVPLPANSTGSAIPASTLTSLQQMLVYYISVITHNYVQGKDFTTTLTLTHGRHWTDALPSGSVGYGVSGNQTDSTYQTMLSFYGQGNPTLNISNFISVASQKLNFIANGVVPPQSTNSQFGFTATPVKPSALQAFETRLSTAVNSALLRLRASICNPQSTENDPKQAAQSAKDEETNIISAIEAGITSAENAISTQWNNVENLFKNAVGKSEKILQTYENKLQAALEQKALELEDDLNNPEVLAFQAELGGKAFKIIKSEAFTTGTLLNASGASTYLAPLKSAGVNTSAITSFGFGIAAYVYVASSPTSIADAQTKAATQVIANAKTLLKISGVPKKFAQIVVTSTTGMKHTSGGLVPTIPPPPSLSSVLSGSSTPAAPAPAASTTPAAPQQTYYVLGTMIVGINPVC